MTPKIKSNFLYMTCNFGSEKALIHEVQKSQKNLKLGFSKKGFITFKSDGEMDLSSTFPLVFAHTHGLSLDKFKIVGEDLSPVLSFVNQFLQKYPSTLVHVFPRERVDKVKDDPELSKLAAKNHVLLSNHVNHPSAILDLVMVEEDEIWIGVRALFKDQRALRGNHPEIELPKEAPSRAYLKMAEAYFHFGSAIKKDEVFMEIGSAPGGASYFLLQQGHTVIGVDNGQMDKNILAHKAYHHVDKTAGLVNAKDIKVPAQWLAMDINVKPDIAFLELKKLLPHLKDLKGAMLTFKMPGADSYLQVEDYVKRIKKLGFKQAEAKQLFYNKQEIFIFAKK